MKTFAVLASLLVVIGSVVACSDDESSSENSFTCRLNGACYQCPSADAVATCAKEGASAAKCTAAADSVCDR